MTDTPTQPVVDANAAAAPAADAQTNGGDDLDTLLSQFETATQAPPSPPQTAAVTPELQALANEVQTLKGQLSKVSNIEYKTDIAETIKNVRGDLDPEIFDDTFMETYLDAQARQDERLQRAFMERKEKPRAWQKIQTEIGKNFARKFSKLPDRQVTEDREAVTAAVRGASTKAPSEPAPDYKSMSNAELRDEMRKLGVNPTF